MRLDTFLLADAVAAAEGKVYVHGGSLTRLMVPALPFPVGQLGIFARLQPDDDDELRRPHDMLLTIVGPTGRPNVPPLPFVVPPQPLPELLEGEVRFLDLVVNVGGITILREGLHVVELRCDGELLGAAPLPAALIQADAGDNGTPSAS